MVIVVLGASGGLGGYVAGEMAKKYPVIGTFLSNEREIPGVEMVYASVTDDLDMNALASVVEDDKEIVLVNMAGLTCSSYTHKMSERHWTEVLSTNLDGAFLACRSFLPVMRSNRWGRIINIASVVSKLCVPGTSAYAASKEGIVGLTRIIARENASMGITANVLSLGYFDRGMITDVPERMLEVIEEMIPTGHLGHPRNIVAAIEFLIEADYVTGAVIPINGGLA